MRVITKVALPALMLMTGLSFGQQSTKVQPTQEKPARVIAALDELLNAALRNNPDVQVAEAKLREAEAELRRTQLNLAQKLVDQHIRLTALREELVARHEELTRLDGLRKAGQAPESDYRRTLANVERAKADLAQAEGLLNSLAGTVRGVTFTLDGSWRLESGSPGVEGGRGRSTTTSGGPGTSKSGSSGTTTGRRLGAGFPTPGGMVIANGPKDPFLEKVRAALEAPFKMKDVRDTPLAEVLKQFQAAAPDVPFLIELGDKKNVPINLPLTGEIPLRAAFQALQDVVPGLECHIRQYGILITMDGGE